MTKDEIYQDVLTLKKMNAPIEIKIKMLNGLLGVLDDIWQVVGITQEALTVFSSYDFQRVSKMGINRAHLAERHQSYKVLLEDSFSSSEWWEFFYKNNLTVLTTSKENMSKDLAWQKNYFPIDPELGLFKSKGFAWTHGQKERDFLIALHKAEAIN